MTFQIRVVTITDNGQEHIHQITSLERTALQPETLGLSLAESKAILRDPACHRGAANCRIRRGAQSPFSVRTAATEQRAPRSSHANRL